MCVAQGEISKLQSRAKPQDQAMIEKSVMYGAQCGSVLVGSCSRLECAGKKLENESLLPIVTIRIPNESNQWNR